MGGRCPGNWVKLAIPGLDTVTSATTEKVHFDISVAAMGISGLVGWDFLRDALTSSHAELFQ